MSAFKIDESKQQEVQELTEQYLKKQDPKLMERIQKLSAEMMAPMEQAAAASEKSMANVAQPSGAAPIEQIYYLVAEEKPGHASKLVLVYRQPVVERTVIQMAWDLRDYPPAWGGDAQ